MKEEMTLARRFALRAELGSRGLPPAALDPSPASPATGLELSPGSPVALYDLTIEANGYAGHHAWLRSGELTCVMAVGSGDLDLYVYDDSADLVAFEGDFGQSPLCLFTPQHTGLYSIVVVNATDDEIEYCLWVN